MQQHQERQSQLEQQLIESQRELNLLRTDPQFTPKYTSRHALQLAGLPRPDATALTTPENPNRTLPGMRNTGDNQPADDPDMINEDGKRPTREVSTGSKNLYLRSDKSKSRKLTNSSVTEVQDGTAGLAVAPVSTDALVSRVTPGGV